MKYYDCSGVEHEFDLSDNIGHGWCGDVYRYDSEWVLKKYRDFCSGRLRLKKDIYDIVKELDSKYIVEFKDLLFKDKDAKAKTPIDGYTCRYVRPEMVDILSMPTDYLTDNIDEISKVFAELSNRGVRVSDLKGSNVIIQNDKIVLIDIDLFHRVRTGKKKLNRLNQLDLLYLFKEILSDSVYEYEHNFNYLDVIDDVFADFSKSSDSVLEVQKQFQKYKCPADYLKSRL